MNPQRGAWASPHAWIDLSFFECVLVAAAIEVISEHHAAAWFVGWWWRGPHAPREEGYPKGWERTW